MYCRICGTENNTKFYPSKRQTLCSCCAEDTPRKAGRESFDRQYWGAKFEDVPNGIRREFYSDYLASNLTLSQYKESTTETVG